MKNLLVTVQLSQIEHDVENLIEDIRVSSGVTINGSTNLSKIFEQLSDADFNDLRKNKFYLNFLKNICIYKLSDSDILNELEPKDEIILPNYSTTLENLDLPERFLKLIKRLKSIESVHASFKLGNTLGDLLDLSSNLVASLPGVGITYIENFKELKLLSERKDGGVELEISVDEFSNINLDNMKIIKIGIDKKFTKALEKYERYIKPNDLSDNLREILNFNKITLKSIPGFGDTLINKLLEFSNLLKEELRRIVRGDIDFQKLESDFIYPKDFSYSDFDNIEKILLQDIDNFFELLKDDEIDILQKRWGFVEEKRTLEEIGLDYGLTRERIRQIESKVNKKFIQYLRVDSQDLWKIIQPELSYDFYLKFDLLFSCFPNDKDFYLFLDFICDQKDLYEYVFPQLNKNILNDFFVNDGAPLHLEKIKQRILELDIPEILNVDNALKFLSQENVILIEGEYIWPKQLGKAEASACILVNHQKGLPWRDIAKLVNANSLSKTAIYESRLDLEAFNSPDHIFLAGKGVYKHTNFIDKSIILDDIFMEILEYAELNSRKVFHLNECYQSSIPLQKFDYYEIRYFVKNFGEDFGLFFKGRSQSDSVGFEKEFKNFTQKDVIIKKMNSLKKPLTKPEIASLLKSKSARHASFYLDNLIEEGKVIQVEYMLYTTPDVAYKDIDINQYVGAISELLKKYQKPIETSIFKTELNKKFSKTYSKHFYASIARLHCKQEGWFRTQSLFSITEIPFESIKDVLDYVCKSDLSVEENILLIRKEIEINQETASIAIRNWKSSL